MNAQDVLGVLTVVVVGVMVGVEFAVAVFVSPILDRLPNDYGLDARSDGARVLGAAMPPWYIGSLVLGAAWAAVAWGDAGTYLVVWGAALLVVTVVMSLIVLVPINSRSKTWTRQTAPADWKQQLGRWDRFHYLRVALIVLAFAHFAAALAAA